MNRVKKLLATFAFALSAAAAYAGSGAGVTVLLRDGGKVSFAFAEKPVMGLTSDGLKISAEGKDAVSYLFADVQRFYFEDDIDSGISSVTGGDSSHAVFSYADGSLHVSGLPAATAVHVYTADGKTVVAGAANADGKATINLSSQPAGVYVVGVKGGAGFKLQKK